MLPELDIYFAADLVWHGIKDLLEALSVGQGLKFQFDGGIKATIEKTEQGRYYITAPGEKAWYAKSSDVTDALFVHTVGTSTNVKNVAKLQTVSRI